MGLISVFGFGGFGGERGGALRLAASAGAAARRRAGRVRAANVGRESDFPSPGFFRAVFIRAGGGGPRRRGRRTLMAGGVLLAMRHQGKFRAVCFPPSGSTAYSYGMTSANFPALISS